MSKIISFVPARGGSSRVPKKNLREIGGIPMFLRACYNLNQILEKEQIIVDSDDDEILELAKRHGFGTLKRPSELATNTTDGNSFFRWETLNYPDCDIYIQHLPPMTFLSKQTLKNCIDAVEKEGYDSIVCVGKEPYYLWDAGTNLPQYDLKNIPNSFTLKKTMFETMGLYVINATAHRETGLRIGSKFKIIEVNKIEQVDINYPEDFELAEAIEAGLPLESPYKSKHIFERGKNK